MKKNREVSKYARAIYDIAEKSNSIEETLNRLNILFSINSTSSEFRLFLQTRRVLFKDKVEILNKILANILSEIEMGLLNSLIENDHVNLLNQIIKQYVIICEQDEKVVKVMVTTAQELSSDDKKELLNLIEKKINKKVDLNDFVEPKILGGAKFRVGNMIVDGSIASRLGKLEKSLYGR
tara:strand:+ start:1334 stop:1873 length:540 start_codon:yes stop_codon:yes gene_type:complete